MSIFEDYDGYFDLPGIREETETVLDLHLEDIGKNGFSREKYQEVEALFPGTFNGIQENRLTVNRSVMGQELALESMNSVMGFMPGIRVTVQNGVVLVSGIPTNLLVNYIYKHWNSVKIANNIFIQKGMRYFSFYSFYALEVIYILKEITKDKGVRGTLIKNICSAISENTWVSRIDSKKIKPRFDYSQLDRLNLPLLPSQRDYLELYEDRTARFNLKGYCLAAPPGSGKTLCGYAMSLVCESDINIFVVPNNSVQDVWVQTIETRFKTVPTYWTSHMSTKFTGNEEYLICHYESIKYLLEGINRFKGKRVMLWVDESHNFNEINTGRTKMLVELFRTVNLVSGTWASGTPFKAIGKEAVPMMRCFDPTFTDKVEASFIKIFGATKGAALDILAHRMGHVMYRIEKTEVVNNGRVELDQLVQFPGMHLFTLDKIGADIRAFIIERSKFYKDNMPSYVSRYFKVIEAVRCRLTRADDMNRMSKYLADTKAMHKNFQPVADRERVVECNMFEREVLIPLMTNDEKREFRKVASVYKYVALTIRGEALGRILTRARIDCFNSMVPHSNLSEIILAARKKTLIFTSYVEVADKLKAQCERDGFKPLVVYGDTNKQLPAIMREFQNNPNANPLIATFDSLSTAVPVVDASTVVMFNAPFRDYIRDQAISRSDRLGQDGEVTVVNVLLDTGKDVNISTRSKDILEWSKEQVDAIMGNTGPTVAIETLSDTAEENVFINLFANEFNRIKEARLLITEVSVGMGSGKLESVYPSLDVLADCVDEFPNLKTVNVSSEHTNLDDVRAFKAKHNLSDVRYYNGNVYDIV